MADDAVEMKPTLGLTGLTMNAMALIAPGAFLWRAFAGQSAADQTAADWLMSAIKSLNLTFQVPADKIQPQVVSSVVRSLFSKKKRVPPANRAVGNRFIRFIRICPNHLTYFNLIPV